MTDTVADQTEFQPIHHRPWVWWTVGGVAVLVVVSLAGFELFYAGRVLPGVLANGVKVAGLSKDGATAKLTPATATYAKASIPMTYTGKTIQLPVSTLALKYDNNAAAERALGYGRTGSMWQRVHEQVRAMLGRSTNFADYTFNDAALAATIAQVSDAVSVPATDATLSFANNQTTVTPATDGRRLDIGMLILNLQNHFDTTSTHQLEAPVYSLPAAVSTAALTAAAPRAATNLAAPLTLTYDNITQAVDQATIAKWIKVAATPAGNFIDSHNLSDLYPQTSPTNLSIDHLAITTYVASMGASVNQSPVNAQLAMINGVLTVTKPAEDGIELDQSAAVKAIVAALSSASVSRLVTIPAKAAKADVREDNLASLGITDQLSEGETYFPGSPAGRLQNVRAGAARFNGVLLAPGEQFSFGKLLGEVDASTGYVPELVILADHEEDQYGGGLCQVSSTAFRAALNAGLPINERVNHAFAISYYTWPYSVPGLDATIYYPAIDFKFTNDTGHYLLMQTTMKGYDLKFDYFGTKAKSGVIRGPYFVSGSNDATKPSQTVFYRDVLDASGNVTKTDTFNTYYKSSLLYPVELKGSK